MPNDQVFFDHVEVHVEDVVNYCKFLVKLFNGGRHKVISDTGTSMFVSNDGINIEIKKREVKDFPHASGFCNPCLRMEHAKDFIEHTLKFKITKTVSNPDGGCYFFNDHEGITWHVKDYLIRDKFINW